MEAIYWEFSMLLLFFWGFTHFVKGLLENLIQKGAIMVIIK